MTSNKLTRITINLFVAGIFLYYLIFGWKNYPFSIGGTLVFSIIIGIAEYFSIRFRLFAFELSLMSLISLLLIGLNFLAYIESSTGFTSLIMVISIAITILLHWLMVFLLMRPFHLKKMENLIEADRDFIKEIAYFFSQSAIILIPFIVSTAAFFMAMKKTNNAIVEKGALSFTSFCMFWLLISLMYNLSIIFRKRKYLELYFLIAIHKRSEVNNKFLRWLSLMIISMLAIGSGFEIQRGNWFLWVISWATLVVCILVEWETWRFVFTDLNVNHRMPAEVMERNDTILLIKENLLDSNRFKKIMIVFLSLLAYFFILLMISSYFRRN